MCWRCRWLLDGGTSERCSAGAALRCAGVVLPACQPPNCVCSCCLLLSSPAVPQTELAFQAFLQDAQAFYLHLAAALQQRYGPAGFPPGQRATRVAGGRVGRTRVGGRRWRGPEIAPTCAATQAPPASPPPHGGPTPFPTPSPHARGLAAPSCCPLPAALAAQQLQALGREMPQVAAGPAPADCRPSVHRCLVCLGDLTRCACVCGLLAAAGLLAGPGRSGVRQATTEAWHMQARLAPASLPRLRSQPGACRAP